MSDGSPRAAGARWTRTRRLAVGSAGIRPGHNASARTSRGTNVPRRVTRRRIRTRTSRPPKLAGGISSPARRAENRPSNWISISPTGLHAAVWCSATKLQRSMRTVAVMGRLAVEEEMKELAGTSLGALDRVSDELVDAEW